MGRRQLVLGSKCVKDEHIGGFQMRIVGGGDSYTGVMVEILNHFLNIWSPGGGTCLGTERN